MADPEKLICEVCEKEEAVGVASVPGVPYSAAYCRKCLAADAHPLGILVANTACIGGMEYAAEWWKEIVEHTLKHCDVPREKFDADVAEAIKGLSGYE